MVCGDFFAEGERREGAMLWPTPRFRGVRVREQNKEPRRGDVVPATTSLLRSSAPWGGRQAPRKRGVDDNIAPAGRSNYEEPHEPRNFSANKTRGERVVEYIARGRMQ